MKKLLLFILSGLFLISINAQTTVNFEWVRKTGDAGSDQGRSVAVDASGNVYTAGSFQGTVDFDPGTGTYTLASLGSDDAYVTKFDAFGNFIWAKTFGGTLQDIAYDLDLDQNGNIYTTGHFENTVDFDPSASTYTITSLGLQDVFINKLDPLGNFMWTKVLGGTNSNVPYSIDVDATGNVHTAGYFSGSIDLDPSASTYTINGLGGFDIFISKLDAFGNFLWGKSIAGTSNEIAYAITTDASGNVYTTGYYAGTVDFDPNAGSIPKTSSGNQPDVFISKLDASGNYVNAIGLVGNWTTNQANSIKVNNTGEVYIGGAFDATIDFDPGTGTANLGTTAIGDIDIFIAKYDASLNYIWAKRIGSTFGESCLGIDLDASDNIYATGYFRGTVDFDPNAGVFNMATAGSNATYFLKLDPLGDFIWARNIAAASGNSGNGIVVNSLNDVYTVGGFAGNVDFDPNTGTYTLTAVGSNDTYVHKMSQCIAYASPVNTTPIPNLTICQNQTTTLTATGTGTVNWFATSTSTTVLGTGLSFVTPTLSAGTFTYYASTTNTCGLSSIRTPFTITANAMPSITVNSGSICAGNSFTINPSGASTYTFSGGSIVSPTLNTSYTVTGTGVNGCVNSIGSVSSVTVNALPTISVNSGSICAGNNFTITPSGASTYTIEGGGAVKTPTATTTYTVIGKSAAGCTSSTFATSSVTVNARPIIAVNSGAICSGQSFTLTPSGASTYTIQGGSAIKTPTANTSYTVIGTSAAGCASSTFATSNVTVNPIFTPSITIPTNSIVAATGGTATASSSFSTNTAATAFDGNNTLTGWGNNAIMPSWLEYNFGVGNNKIINQYSFYCSSTMTGGWASSNYNPTAWTFEGYNGSSWVVLDTRTDNTPAQNVWKTYSFTNITAYQKYRINISASIDGSYVMITELQFYYIKPIANCINKVFHSISNDPSGNYQWQLNGSPIGTNTNSVTIPYFYVNDIVSCVLTTSNTCATSSLATSNQVILTTGAKTNTTSATICTGQIYTVGTNTYNATGTYSTTGTSFLGCDSISIVNLTVNPSPTISVNSGSICSGNNFTITPSGASTYTIQGGSAVKTPTANATYTVIGTNTAGCVSSTFATSSVTVNTTPTIAVNSGSICAGNNFTISPSGANTYTIQGGSAIKTPTSNTTYTVTGTSSAGCVSSSFATSSITVNATPTITVNSGSICAGNNFTITPSGANTYTIQGGSAIKTPTANATYTVIGTSSAGCVSSTFATSNVTVNATPTITANSGSICEGQSFTISPSGANTYTIQGGSAIKTPTANATYTVIGTSSAGCVSSTFAISNVTVNATPIITVNSGDICSGNSFTIIPSGANTYTFSNGNVVSPLTNTNYTITGTGINGCVNSIGAISSVTVNSIPTITIANGAICPGGSFTLSPSGASSYTFSGGSSVVSPSITTTYSVSGTSAAGCITNSSAVATVSVTNTLSVSITGNNIICEGQTANLTAGGATTYTWNTGVASSTIAPSPTSNTSYSVIGSSGSCSNTAVITVTVNPLPTINATSNNTIICTGETATLTASGASSYTWNPAGTGITVSVSPTVTTNYTVTGTDANGCDNNTVITQSVSLCTGINNITTSNNIMTLFPNPSSSILTIQTIEEIKTVYIFNTLGDLVKTETSNSFSVEHLASGIYMIHVKTDKGINTLRFIRE